LAQANLAQVGGASALAALSHSQKKA